MQTLTVKTLLERIIDNDRLSHTYMFEGDSIETMKRYAEYFALLILGESSHNKVLIDSRNHPDYQYVYSYEPTIKKQQIEQLVHQMHHKPVASAYKVYVIEAFEKLTLQAENSILKFLEEPPDKTIAILLTVDKSQILPTIHSRSQHIHIKREQDDSNAHLDHLHEADKHIVQTLGMNAMHVAQLADNFHEMIKATKQFTVRWLQDDPHALIDLIGLLELAPERRDYPILLQLMYGIVRQCLHQVLDLAQEKAFNDIDITQISPHISAERLTGMLDEITTANRLLTSNVNAMLVFESMVISSKG